MKNIASTRMNAWQRIFALCLPTLSAQLTAQPSLTQAGLHSASRSTNERYNSADIRKTPPTEVHHPSSDRTAVYQCRIIVEMRLKAPSSDPASAPRHRLFASSRLVHVERRRRVRAVIRRGRCSVPYTTSVGLQRRGLSECRTCILFSRSTIQASIQSNPNVRIIVCLFFVLFLFVLLTTLHIDLYSYLRHQGWSTHRC